jgi:hypothetical protein
MIFASISSTLALLSAGRVLSHASVQRGLALEISGLGDPLSFQRSPWGTALLSDEVGIRARIGVLSQNSLLYAAKCAYNT